MLLNISAKNQIIKIDLYYSELYCFKVGAFLRHSVLLLRIQFAVLAKVCGVNVLASKHLFIIFSRS